MRKEFFEQAGRLFTWTLAGQIAGLLSAPLVARLYGPEAYGLAMVVITASATVAIVSSGRYEQAIVVAESEKDSVALQLLCRAIISVIGLVTLLACIVLYAFPPESISVLFGDNLYLLMGVPIIAVMNGLAVVRRRVLNREKSYSQIGSAAFSNSIVVPASRVIFGLISHGNSLMLVVSGMLGWATEVLRLRPTRTKARDNRRHLPRNSLRNVARKYSDFPLFSLPEGLMSNISIQLPIYTFGFIYSPAVTGLYALASRIVRTPVLALSTSVSQVLFRQFEEHRRKGGKLVGPMTKSTVGLLLVSTIIGLPIMVFADPVFRVVLGESWATAGLYAAILVPWTISGVSIIPARTSMVIIRRQGIWLSTQIGLFILRILIIVAAVVFHLDVLTTLWAFSLTSAGYNALTFIGVFFILLHSDSVDNANLQSSSHADR